ncbi:MAG TPA: hypothetical protein VLJ39_08420 [Tepidisphaeraceae bacterium]|nr:hypothetical protein [Tepidisphaeraceae bacterium]
MTLIIASVRPHDIVLTADGRSETIVKGVVTGVDDHYQKLFPIPDHPVVIAHMGENLLGGKPVKAFLAKFIAGLNTGNFTIQEIADQLRAYAHPAIRARLNALGKPRFGVNLWVAGFGSHDEGPSVIETFWKYSDESLLTTERRFSPFCVVPGGDGQFEISKVDWHEIQGKSVDEVRAYHHRIMEQALHAKTDNNSVGGRIHELVITPASWRWTEPPDGTPVEKATTTQSATGS